MDSPLVQIALGLVLGAVVGVSVLFANAWGSGGLRLGQAESAAPVATAPVATRSIVTPASMGLAPSTTALTPATTAATPVPTAAEVWAGMMPQLDATWGVDTQRTIELLDAFRQRFPDYPPAREKLYAALLAYGSMLDEAGDADGAAASFARAAALQPERGEAAAALASLTPSQEGTPVPLTRRTPAPALTPSPQ